MSARYVTWIDGAQATVEILEITTARSLRALSLRKVSREVAFHRLDDGSGDGQVTMNDGRSVEGARLSVPRQQLRVMTTGEHRVEVQAISERDAWMARARSGKTLVRSPCRCQVR